jgi:hypothetical protein
MFGNGAPAPTVNPESANAAQAGASFPPLLDDLRGDVDLAAGLVKFSGRGTLDIRRTEITVPVMLIQAIFAQVLNAQLASVGIKPGA